ncbi:DUF3895 domain-containing protein [Paenibacillus sp. UNC451MF]|uniref:DUF3895 domain-containing protein n=1 Tax=Paenibacillus sp. UNC451MF TaxID=1449063 RepID=UPI00048EB6F7|nr:DUF3895 domain-containing protein [Paenibacillus sp. UNC451MF]
MKIYTSEERDALLARLNDQQRQYLNEDMIRGRRTVFANVMSRGKGYFIPEGATFEDIEHLLTSWVYINYIDAGHVSSELKCECGRALRYQHIVQNKEDGVIKKFGIDHLQLHTGIDAKIVAEILKGFDAIDFELDEILSKIEKGWSMEMQRLPDLRELTLPNDIQKHLELGLPLLDRQVVRIRRLANERIVSKSRFVQPPSLADSTTSDTVTDGNDLIQLDLFAMESPVNISQSGVTSSTILNDQLSSEQQMAILSLLQEGVSSARTLCELLIKHHGASGQRFEYSMTKKPQIYPIVCRFIDSCENSLLIRGNQEDRYYEWI